METNNGQIHAFYHKNRLFEILENFWIVVNGIAATFYFGAQTNSLIYDVSILNMRNTIVQQVEDRYPETKKYVVAFKESVEQEKSIWGPGVRIMVVPGLLPYKKYGNHRKSYMVIYENIKS